MRRLALERHRRNPSCLSWSPQAAVQLMNSRNVSLPVLAAGRPRAKHWRGSFSVREGASELCGVPFVRVLIPFMRAPPTWPNPLPKATPFNTTAWGLGLPHVNLGGHKHSEHGDGERLWEEHLVDRLGESFCCILSYSFCILNHRDAFEINLNCAV